MIYSDFDTRWTGSGGAERANYGLFLHELCALIGVAPPYPTTDNPAQDAYVLERAVVFADGTTGPTFRTSTGRIDLYKRGCFVLETKQGTDSPEKQKAADRAELGLPPEKRRKGRAGHCQVGTNDANGSATGAWLCPCPAVRRTPAPIFARGRCGVLYRRVQQFRGGGRWVCPVS